MPTRSKPAPKTVKQQVVVVDDHPMVRERLAELIDREPDLMTCGEAEDAAQALKIIEASKPHLAIIDLTLKNSDGLELIKNLKTLHPKLCMLVLSMHDESVYAARVLRAGARGYITKQQASHKVLEAIRCVLRGDVYLSPEMSARILREVAHDPSGSPLETLSDRELEVFRRMGLGQGTREIAESLHIGIRTVESYRYRIKRKLHVTSAPALLQRAVQWVEAGAKDSRGL